jgi:hypothetical protein
LLKDELKVNIPSKSDPVLTDSPHNITSNLVGKINFAKWKLIIDKNFPALTLSAEVGLSLFGQLLIKDITNPCAIVLVDVPSSGKTITLNMFSGLLQSYTTDNFTPSAFVSQAANVKREELNKVDLLPRIRNKVLIVRDLAPIFGQRDDDLLKSMGVLTRVMDGEGLQLDAGVHGRRGYVGDYNFMLLAASTPIPPKIFKLMGNLGSRLFFLSLQSKRKSEEELINQLVNCTWKEKQKECALATEGLIQSLFNKYQNGVVWDRNNDPEEIVRIIAKSARLLACLRGSINVWKENSLDGVEYSYQEPVIEMPDRISQILYNLARGHALVCGREKLNKGDVGLILNIAFDSAPSSRAKIFRLLIANDGFLTTAGVVSGLNCSDTTADKEMEILRILGIGTIDSEVTSNVGRPQKTITLSKEFGWFKSEDCFSLNKTSKQKEEDVLTVAERIFNEGGQNE